MRRLNRPVEPPEFTRSVSEFLLNCPPVSSQNETARWQSFRDAAGYSAASKELEKNQSSICAYCEISLRILNKQIEHYIPKSSTTSDNDLTLDFSNMLLCCAGGTYSHSHVQGEFSDDPSAQANHSCGAKKDDTHPAQTCLNPYELPNFPLLKLVLYDSGVGFAPDKIACRRASLDMNLIRSTLDCLNLNCSRLNERRKAICEVLEEEIVETQKLPSKQQEQKFENMAETYLYAKQPAFFTTKLLYMADFMPHLIP